jgi:hypothetical protein
MPGEKAQMKAWQALKHVTGQKQARLETVTPGTQGAPSARADYSNRRFHKDL